MALVNLKTIYKDLKWQYDGGVPHGDPNAKKPRFTEVNSRGQQNLFYQNNIGKLLGPLANLTTQYKNKSFSSDEKLNGYSGLPYIKFDMSGSANFGDNKTISTAGTSLIDYPIRGGNYPSRDIDYERIKAFLESDKGKLFIEKQKTLQFMNPKTETGLNASDPSSVLGASILENTRVYSSRNTLDQVSVQGTGTHISRVGNPYFNINALSSRYGSYLNFNDEFYGDIVGKQNIENSSAANRLEILRRLKVLDPKQTSTNFLDQAQLYLYAKKLGIATNLGITSNRELLFNYPGGPNYSSKFGSTIIKRVVDTTIQTVASPTAMRYNQLAKANKLRSDNPSIDLIDFRPNTEKYDERTTKVTPSTTDAITWDAAKTFERRLKTSEKTTNPKQGVYTTTIKRDMLNMKEVISNLTTDPYIDPKNPKDFIKFGFECMSNDNPGSSDVILFRAFLSNGFTDSNTAQLTPFRYFGRGDEFYTYGGFSRNIQFSFKIVVKSRDELAPLYIKLNKLIGQVYPDYSPGNGVMRAPLIKLTMGDYLYRVPGFLDSINVTADNATPWEINLENYSDVQQLPHVLEVQVTFKPIHGILPSRGANLITHNFEEVITERNKIIQNIKDLSNNFEGAIAERNRIPQNINDLA